MTAATAAAAAAAVADLKGSGVPPRRLCRKKGTWRAVGAHEAMKTVRLFDSEHTRRQRAKSLAATGNDEKETRKRKGM